MSYRRAQIALALVAAAAGCGGAPAGLEVTVMAGADAPRPTYLSLSWLSERGPLFEGPRVPQAGSLPQTGPVARIFVETDGGDRSDRKIVVHGFTAGLPASIGAGRIAADDPGPMVVILHAHLSDSDGDGWPDVVDDCVGPGPSRCSAPPSDGGGPMMGGVDAGSVHPQDAGPSPPHDAALPPGQDTALPSPQDAALPPADAGHTDRPPAVSVDGPALAPAGLVALWRFDEGAGTLARDDSPNHNDGKLAHPTGRDWTAGESGAALALAGASWMSAPASPSFDAIQTGLTLSAWMSEGVDTAEVQTAIARQRGTGSDDVFWLGVRAGIVRFTVMDHPLEAPAAPLATGRFTHVAATYDGATMVIYIGGTEAARLAWSARMTPGSNAVSVGADINGASPDDGDRFFVGALDEVAVYDRPLTPAEIAALAQR